MLQPVPQFKTAKQNAAKVFLFVASLCALLGFVSPAWSLATASLIDLNELAPLEPKQQASSSAEISFEQNQFLSDPTNTSTQSSTGSLGIRLKHESGTDLRRKAVLNGEFSLGEKTPYVAVPELYLEKRFSSSGLFLNAGRKKRPWSQMDEQWSLGLWQPLARWDYFKPESQGLIGAGVGIDRKTFGAELFASPLFVPDQGPQFDLVDGQFESQNRWFWRPQTEVGVFDERTDIRYKLFRPSEQDTISQFSIAGRLWAGEFKKTAWASVAYAYKPMNQFHLAVDPRYQIVSSEVDAAIYPEIIHHHLASIEGGVGNQKLYGSLSFNREWPEKADYPDTYLQSPLQENFWASASIGHELGLRDFNMVWSYLKRWPIHERESVNLLGTSVESSYGRFPIEEAASVSWYGTILRVKTTTLRWRNQYWYSIAERGSWLSSGLDFQTSRDMLWRLEVDVLGTSLPEDDTQGLVSRYRSNDRVLGGFHYIF